MEAWKKLFRKRKVVKTTQITENISLVFKMTDKVSTEELDEFIRISNLISGKSKKKPKSLTKPVVTKPVTPVKKKSSKKKRSSVGRPKTYHQWEEWQVAELKQRREQGQSFAQIGRTLKISPKKCKSRWVRLVYSNK